VVKDQDNSRAKEESTLAVSERKQKSCVTVAGLTDNINTIKGHDHPTYYGVKRDELPYVKEHRDGEAFQYGDTADRMSAIQDIGTKSSAEPAAEAGYTVVVKDQDNSG